METQATKVEHKNDHSSNNMQRGNRTGGTPISAELKEKIESILSVR